MPLARPPTLNICSPTLIGDPWKGESEKEAVYDTKSTIPVDSISLSYSQIFSRQFAKRSFLLPEAMVLFAC
jgi:hypothetical protein